MEEPIEQSVTYRHASSQKDFETARDLFVEYAKTLGLDLSFQNFDEELKVLPERYGGAKGDLIFAFVENRLAGAVAVHEFEPGIAEMKRLYVRNAFRGLGIGHELVARIIASATKLGYQKIRLDTLKTMGSARKIYQEAGFYEIGVYRYNPRPDALYMECSV